MGIDRVIFMTPEVTGLVKQGGLGDVSKGLPAALQAQGLDVTTVIPEHGAIPAHLLANAKVLGTVSSNTPDRPNDKDVFTVKEIIHPETGVPVVLLGNTNLFPPGVKVYDDTYTTPSRYEATRRYPRWGQAAWNWIKGLPHKARTVLHLNDHPTAEMAKTVRHEQRQKPDTPFKTLLTLHNAGYLGQPEGPQGSILPSPLLLGATHANGVTTVSPTHRLETLAAQPWLDTKLQLALEAGDSKDRYWGILNGIDTKEWNPATDTHLVKPYDVHTYKIGKAACKADIQQLAKLPVENDQFVIGVVSRLDTKQKGLNWLIKEIPDIVKNPKIQLIVLGEGDHYQTADLNRLAQRFPKQVAFINRMDESVAHKIFAGSDTVIAPSVYEPCGLTQMYGMRYGTPPLVRKTGGFIDTVKDEETAGKDANGFLLIDIVDTQNSYTKTVYKPDIKTGIERAFKVWQTPRWDELIKTGMNTDFGWDKSAREYIDAYEALFPPEDGSWRTRKPLF